MLKIVAKSVSVILSALVDFTLHSCPAVGKQADGRMEKYHYERKAGM